MEVQLKLHHNLKIIKVYKEKAEQVFVKSTSTTHQNPRLLNALQTLDSSVEKTTLIITKQKTHEYINIFSKNRVFSISLNSPVLSFSFYKCSL